MVIGLRVWLRLYLSFYVSQGGLTYYEILWTCSTAHIKAATKITGIRKLMSRSRCLQAKESDQSY